MTGEGRREVSELESGTTGADTVALADREGPVCDVCGTADALGIRTCAACAGPESDSLLFIERSIRRADRRAIETWLLDSLAGTVSRDAAHDVAAGVRPVVGLPEAAAARAAGSLSLRGLHTVAVPRARAWTRLPPRFVVLLGAVLGAGLFAATAAGPPMLWVTLALTGLMAIAAIQALRAPVWMPERSPVLGLADGVEQRVRSTLAGLVPGRARGYLTDLAALSLPLLSPPSGDPGRDTVEGVEQLLELAAGAAIDLDRLDGSLAVLEERDDAGAMDVSVAEAIARASETRARLVARFEEALASLARLQVASIETPDRLVELAERLAEDAARRSEARAEVDRLID